MRLGLEQCQPLGNGSEGEGCDTWRILLQMVQGFLEGKDGVQITSGNVVLQMVLDEPPERLYNRWVKDRIEFYKRLEPTAPLRDVPLKVDPNPVHRLRFSISNGLGNVSDAIWNIVLANPEKAGLEGIHHVADKHIGY